MKNQIVALLSIFVLFSLVVAIVNPIACTKPQEAKRTLQEEKFTEIEVGEYKFFNFCGRSQSFANEFKATSPSGVKTEGIVCCDFANNCSVHH